MKLHTWESFFVIKDILNCMRILTWYIFFLSSYVDTHPVSRRNQCMSSPISMTETKSLGYQIGHAHLQSSCCINMQCETLELLF